MNRWKEAVRPQSELHQFKRDAVIREAAHAFGKHGFHATSIDDIAGALNVTKAALYRYVSGKHEILYECHKLSLDLADEALDAAEREAASGLDRLKRFLADYIQVLTGEFGSCVVLTELAPLEPPHHTEIVGRRDRFEARIRAIIQTGIEDKSIRPCDPKLAGFLIMGAFNWIPTWYAEGGPSSGKEIAETFVDLLANGMAA